MSVAREFDKRKSMPIEFTGAPLGLIKNAPHNELPQGAVAGLINAHSYSHEWRPRGASKIHSSLQPPNVRTGLRGTQVGDIITSPNAAFTEGDVSWYWVWPGDVPVHVEIQEYISATQVRVGDSFDRSGNGCSIHGRLNHWKYHRRAKRVVWQWGHRIYIGDWRQLSRTEAIVVSREVPSNTLSDWSDLGDRRVLYNSRGTFLVDMAPSLPTAFKKNTIVPRRLIEDNGDEEAVFGERTEYNHKYYITYSMSRLSENGIRDRTTAGVEILQESGTCELNAGLSPPRDYGIVWTTREIAAGFQTQGRLVGGVMAAAQLDPNYWNGLAAPGASFALTLNGEERNFIVETGAAEWDVSSMDEVATAFESAIQQAWPLATCKFHADGYFIFTSGKQDGSTLSFGGNGIGGTPVGALMRITQDTGATLDNNYVYAAPLATGLYEIPKDALGNYEWHWTHYVPYRTRSLTGRDSFTIDAEGNAKLNDPTEFTWDCEIRVAGAFYACLARTGLVTALVGEFQPYDVGTPLEWEDGDRMTISRYVDSTHVYVQMTGDYYYLDSKPCQAAAIGDGRVLMASQSDDVVTIESTYNTDSIADADERKTIHWSNGYYSIVRERIDATHFRVWDSESKQMQGITLDPRRRVISLRSTDSELRWRQADLHTGLLSHRFWIEMPTCNLGKTVPGFMITARENGSLIFYSQMGSEKTYISGYHLASRQTIDKVEGSITALRVMPDQFIVWTKDATWGGATNNPDVRTLPKYGEAYAKLYIDVIDEHIGLFDKGSVQALNLRGTEEAGVFQLRCADNAWRQFDGRVYSEDFTIDPEGRDRIHRQLEGCWPKGVSCYGDLIGHVYWSKRK